MCFTEYSIRGFTFFFYSPPNFYREKTFIFLYTFVYKMFFVWVVLCFELPINNKKETHTQKKKILVLTKLVPTFFLTTKNLNISVYTFLLNMWFILFFPTQFVYFRRVGYIIGLSFFIKYFCNSRAPTFFVLIFYFFIRIFDVFCAGM